MTDGIIQQIIDLHNKNECRCKHACHNLLRIQQDLIEKIKQVNSLKYIEAKDETKYLNLIPLNILIGENK